MKLLTLKKIHFFICYNNRRDMAIYALWRRRNANEFYVGLLQNLMSKLPEK